MPPSPPLCKHSMPRRRAAALPRISKGLSFPESTNFFQEKPGKILYFEKFTVSLQREP